MSHRKVGLAEDEEEEEEVLEDLGLASNVDKRAIGLRTAEDSKKLEPAWQVA